MKLTNKSRKLSLSQSGQGTVEFTLLIVVGVALVLLLSARVYAPFGKFAKSYMGDYLGCLLDKGALPKLGSEDDACTSDLNMGGLAGSAAGKAGGRSAYKNSEDKSKKGPSADQSEMSNSRSGRTNHSTSTSAWGQGRRSPSAGVDSSAKSGSEGDGTPTSSKSKYYKVSQYSSGPQGTRMFQTSIESLPEAEREKIKKRENKTSVIGKVESDEQQGRPKILRLKASERKIASERPEEPWSFGKLIRIAIIIMIIIAILVFLSGQLLQISKSWEK